jgi:hypothetical protein
LLPGKLIASCGLLLLVLGFAMAAAQDTTLEQQIVGTWAKGKSSELIFNTNGSFLSKMSDVHPNVTKTWNYEGTWQIKDGFCVMTVTNASATGTTNLEADGSVDRAKIVNINYISLVLKFGDQTIAFNRK